MKRLEKKHPLAIRWFHWINFPVLMIMIWSGIMIYWAVDDHAEAHPVNNNTYRVGFGNFTLFHFFPSWFYHPREILSANGDVIRPALYHLDVRLAEGMAWHFFFMWFFAINGILYVLYTFLSGEWRHLLPDRKSFKEAIQVTLHDLHLSKYHPPRRKFNGAQRIAYSSIIVMGAGSLATGLAIYKPVQFGWITTLVGGYGYARFFHFWLTIGYCGFFLVHVTQVARAGWNNFRAMITGYELNDDGKRVPGYHPVVKEEGA